MGHRVIWQKGMMDTLTAIKLRRSVSHYDSTHRMTNKDIRKLMSYVILSPTSFNIQNWRFILVTDSVLRKKIRDLSFNQKQITDASLLVIFCGDLMAWKNPEKCWVKAPADVKKRMVATIKDIYSKDKQLQRDEAIRSCGIAAQTLMIAAKSMGFDTCPMVGFDAKKLGKLIKLPRHQVIAMMVAVGKKIREPWPRPGQMSLDQVAFYNHFKR
jgi:nitroreductase